MTETKSQGGYRLQNHYVICNWNSKVIDIVEQLHDDVNEDTIIAIVTTRPIDGTLLPTDDQANGRMRDVVFYPGDPTRKRTLENVNCAAAKAVIVLADEELGAQADARNLLTLFALQDLERSDERRPHFVIEIVDVANYSKFQQFEDEDDYDIEIIRAESLRTRILAQAARTPGLVSLYHDLLTYSTDTNEIYSVRLPLAWTQGDLTFGHLADQLFGLRDKKDEPLVCIPIGLWKDSTRKILTNPPAATLVEAGDRAVLICRSKPDLKNLAAPVAPFAG